METSSNSATSADRKKHRSIYLNTPGISILQDLTQQDLQVLMESEDEYSRKGSFTRLWPSGKMKDHFCFLPSNNYYDRLLYEWTVAESSHEKRVALLINNLKPVVQQVDSISCSSTLQAKDRILNRLVASNTTLVNSTQSSSSSLPRSESSFSQGGGYIKSTHSSPRISKLYLSTTTTRPKSSVSRPPKPPPVYRPPPPPPRPSIYDFTQTSQEYISQSAQDQLKGYKARSVKYFAMSGTKTTYSVKDPLFLLFDDAPKGDPWRR